ncbi:MAG: hypothetical protein R3323_05805 [Wenzhouxiangellaceae bacterium]|nr:hypothetical protein [Wenzhouxiangellaceae bacterium]
MTRLRCFIVLFAAAWLVACAGPSLDEVPNRVVTGTYHVDAGGQWFVPCGAAVADRYWVTFVGAAVQQRERAEHAFLNRIPGRYGVRWRAALGDSAEGDPEGPGPTSRYALVRELIDTAEAPDAFCGA